MEEGKRSGRGKRGREGKGRNRKERDERGRGYREMLHIPDEFDRQPPCCEGVLQHFPLLCMYTSY